MRIKKLGRTQELTHAGEISVKYDILTFKEKWIAFIGCRIKRKLEIIPRQRELEVIWLKASKTGIKKQIENKKNYFQILVGKYVEGSYR